MEHQTRRCDALMSLRQQQHSRSRDAGYPLAGQGRPAVHPGLPGQGGNPPVVWIRAVQRSLVDQDQPSTSLSGSRCLSLDVRRDMDQHLPRSREMFWCADGHHLTPTHMRTMSEAPVGKSRQVPTGDAYTRRRTWIRSCDVVGQRQSPTGRARSPPTVWRATIAWSHLRRDQLSLFSEIAGGRAI